MKQPEQPLFTEEDIAKYAYFLWQSDGQPPGKDQEYWFKAEVHIKSVGRSQPDKPPLGPLNPVKRTTTKRKSTISMPPRRTVASVT